MWCCNEPTTILFRPVNFLCYQWHLNLFDFGFAPGFVNYKKGCIRLAATSDKVYQLLAHGRCFSPGTPASSTTKTGRHDIAEILLKVALNTINKSINQIFWIWEYMMKVNTETYHVHWIWHLPFFITVSVVCFILRKYLFWEGEIYIWSIVITYL